MSEKPYLHLSRRRHLSAWGLLASLYGPDVGPRQKMPKKPRTWSRPHQGAQERERRRLRIEAGRIPENQILRGERP